MYPKSSTLVLNCGTFLRSPSWKLNFGSVSVIGGVAGESVQIAGTEIESKASHARIKWSGVGQRSGNEGSTRIERNGRRARR